jgi:hypothetical protein
MSTLGARLRVNEKDHIPSEFLIMAPDFILRATLRWRNGKEVGVTTSPFA